MRSADDMSGCKPLPGGKPVVKEKYVQYKYGTGTETVDTCCDDDKKGRKKDE